MVYWVLYLRRKKYVYSGAYPFLPPLLQVFLFCNLLFKQIQSKCFSHFLFFRFLRGWNVTNHVHNFYTCPHSLFCLKLARLYTQLEVDRGNSNPLFYRPNPPPNPRPNPPVYPPPTQQTLLSTVTLSFIELSRVLPFIKKAGNRVDEG